MTESKRQIMKLVSLENEARQILRLFFPFTCAITCAARFAGSGAGETFTVGVQAHEATLDHSLQVQASRQQPVDGGASGNVQGLGALLTAEDLQPMADWCA